MRKPACLIPWLSIWPTASGKVYPCCSSDLEVSELGDLNNSSVDKIINGEEIKSLRRKFLTGELDEQVCKRCIEREQAQGNSMRTMIDQRYSKLAAGFADGTDADGHFKNFQLLFVDFVWSNKCNFKCVHCNPRVSSSIASVPELREFYRYEGPSIRSIVDVNDNVFSDMLEHFGNVDMLHLNGGEPFLIDEHYKILDYLIEKGRTDIKLWIHTNGTILKYKKKNVVDYLKIFKNTRISVSHDGIGKRGEFLRFGYTDDAFLRTVEELEKYAEKVTPAISVHALNLWHLPELLDWHIEHGLLSMGNWPSLNVVTDPAFISFDVHDKETKTTIALRLDAWARERRTVLPDELYDRIENIKNNLTQAPDKKENISHSNKMKETLDIRKRVLGQDAVEIFPEYEIFFKNIDFKSENKNAKLLSS